MARSPLQIQLELDRIHCYDEGDGWGSAEPYLWTVFFKVDGDTVALGDDLFLHGTATIVTTPGSHGNLGDTDVDAGDNVTIPSAIGEFTTTLRPIPVPEFVKALGVEDVGGVVGVATVLMEEDNVSHAGAEAGHAALNTFVQQAIDSLIPTLGVSHPEVTDEDIAALTKGAEGAISGAIQAAQSGWDNFVSWLNADDQIGNNVFTFSHDDLAQNGSQDFSKRWSNEGDWELFGHVIATPTCPAEAAIAVLESLGFMTRDSQKSAIEAVREYRAKQFAGNRGLGEWWRLAERNAAAMTDVLRADPDKARAQLGPVMTEVLEAAMNPRAPIPESAFVALEGLLQTFVAKGSRRLRIDAKTALGTLPKVRGNNLGGAAAQLGKEVPTRKPDRVVLRPPFVRPNPKAVIKGT